MATTQTRSSHPETPSAPSSPPPMAAEKTPVRNGGANSSMDMDTAYVASAIPGNSILRILPLRFLSGVVGAAVFALLCSMLWSPGALSEAGSTHSLHAPIPVVQTGVLLIVWVALAAMGHRGMSCLLSLRDKSASKVLLPRNRFDVGRIAASPHPAEVVAVETFGDGSYECFVGDPVDSPGSVDAINLESDDTVAIRPQRAYPLPTPCLFVDRDLLPEALWKACIPKFISHYHLIDVSVAPDKGCL